MNRFPTYAAREALALRLKLPYSDAMQDWEWEVADFKRFSEFLSAYELLELSESERYSLMEVLIQCAEDTTSEEELAAAWRCIRPLLSKNFELHSETIAYWSCVEAPSSKDEFRVSGYVRELLNSHR